MQQEDNVGPVFPQVVYNNNKITTGNDKLTLTTTTIEHTAPSSDPHDTIKDVIQQKNIALSDIIGEYGIYQLSLTLITFIRYVCVAMMTNSGPLLAPSVDFSCNPPANLSATGVTILKQHNITLQEHLKDKCWLNLSNGTSYECTSWTYNLTEYGVTLTDTFDLVCHRDWLRSTFQSTVSIGVVLSAVVWGSISDRRGRYFAVKLSFICSLFSGIISCFASNFMVYVISRAICTFSDSGLVVSLSTIIVETLGSKHRGAVCIIVYTGWAFGVMIVPWLTEYFRDYSQLMLFTVGCHIVTSLWLLTINESVRWSLVNGHIEEAGEEVKRICRWNSRGGVKTFERSVPELENKFDRFKEKYVILVDKKRVDEELEKANMSKSKAFCLSIFGGFEKINDLFQTRELTTTTMTLVWLTFNSELLYMLFILINSDIGDNPKLNYTLGGISEIVATFLSIYLIAKTTRRLSLISTFVSISCMCFAIAFTHQDPLTSIWLLNITKLAISNLCSLVYVTTTESFPTNLRQTGFGAVGTIGSLGAVVAPYLRTELVNMIGLTYVMLIFVVLPLSAACLIPISLRETEGVELADEVDDLGSDKFDNNIRRRGSSLSRWNTSSLAIN